VNLAAVPSSKDLWRVVALNVMGANALADAITCEDAQAWIKAAANCGIAAAQMRLGRMLLEANLPEDRAAAFHNFKAAADQGDIEAHNMLGRCLENGWGTQIDYTGAAREYRLAAEAGLDWAQYNLGHMLLSGSGVERDRSAAFTWYNRAASQGHVRAMNLVARCYEEGWGTEKSAMIALDWFRRSARGGYFRGAYNYASMLADEGCVAGALHWFDRGLAGAPEPTRTNMLVALGRHNIPAIRALAARVCV
jgi:TPR repeat protein